MGTAATDSFQSSRIYDTIYDDKTEEECKKLIEDVLAE